MNHALYQHMEMLRQQAVDDIATSEPQLLSGHGRIQPALQMTLCSDQARPLPQGASMTVKALRQAELLKRRRRNSNDRWASTPTASSSCCHALPAPVRQRPSLDDSAEWDARRMFGESSIRDPFRNHSSVVAVDAPSSSLSSPLEPSSSQRRFLSMLPPQFKDNDSLDSDNSPPRDAITTVLGQHQRKNENTLVRPQRRPSSEFSRADADEILSSVLLALDVDVSDDVSEDETLDGE